MIKGISNWSVLGILIGLIFSIGTFIRYYIIYPDLSEVVIGVSIGLIIIAISFLYNKQKHQEYTLEDLEEYLADNPINNPINSQGNLNNNKRR